MKNNLADLNNHLFSMLELLDDDKEMADEKKLANTLNRANAMAAVATQILGVANTQLKAIQLTDKTGLLYNELPDLLQIRDCKEQGGGCKK